MENGLQKDTISAGPHMPDGNIEGVPLMDRRRFLMETAKAVAMVAGLNLLAGCDVLQQPIKKSEDDPVVTGFLAETAQTLLNLHGESNGGWRYESQIQDLHYQTDRDVGAASVGMGFIALAKQYPNDTRWKNAAESIATWLTNVSQQDGAGNKYWNDFVDDSGASPAIYTSFDDGAIGIGDFFWNLYEITGKKEYQTTALGTVQWLMSTADTNDLPDGMYRWMWNLSDSNSGHQMGMGEGLLGIVHTLTTYYERTQKSNPDFAAACKQYIDGSLAYLDLVRANLTDRLKNQDNNATPFSGAIPETADIDGDGGTTMNSGYLSGAAGGAMMYLKLYQVFNNSQYLTKANEIFTGLLDSQSGPLVTIKSDQMAWRLALDPEGGDNNVYATGFEEGAAGIGWVFLQAYNLTKNREYLTIAAKAANWLLSDGVAIYENGGITWHEDENNPSGITPPTHSNLNNGAAGIGMFLHDLYLATKAQKYEDGAKGALQWLMNTAIKNGSAVYWGDIDWDPATNTQKPYTKDPSWHWGSAGVIAFIIRMLKGTTDIPGEQPGF